MSEHHIVPLKTYFAVFATLMACTAITVAVAFVDLGPANNIVMLSIAVLKATLVVMFFMHAKYGTRLIPLVAASGFFFVLLMIFGAGLSGEDAGLFGGRRRGVMIDGAEVDLGLVGDVVQVDPTGVLDHLAAGRVPVVSSIAPDLDHPGQSLNVNADAAAAALAVALGAAKLVILTDVPGLYRDWPNRDSLVSHIDATELRAMLPSLESGMIPKMTACLEAVEGGVETAAIIDGRVPHSVLVEIFTEHGIGTEVAAR